MEKKNDNLKIISLALGSGIGTAIFILKLIYYIKKLKSGFFSGYADFAIWMTVSLIISLIPVAFLIRACVIGIMHANEEKCAESLSNSVKMVIVNLVFECISIVGSTMSLDGGWMDICRYMMICHAVTFIPYILMRVSGVKRPAFKFRYR